MIYFSFSEILVASVSFFLLGCLFGGLYQSLITVYNFLKVLFSLPKYSYIRYKKIQISKFNLEQKISNSFLYQIVDFFFALLFGIFLLLWWYVFLDGSIRLFPILFVSSGYLISLKFFSALFSKVINKASSCLLKILLHINFLVLFPIFCLFEVIKRFLSPIINSIKNKYKKLLLHLLIKRKGEKIELFLLKK